MLGNNSEIAGLASGVLPEIKEYVHTPDRDGSSQGSQARRGQVGKKASTPVWSIGSVKTQNRKLKEIEQGYSNHGSQNRLPNIEKSYDSDQDGRQSGLSSGQKQKIKPPLPRSPLKKNSG